jgi:transposase
MGEIVGVCRRTIQRWLRWYREGGLREMEMRLLFRKWGVKRKVAQKADEKAQEAWKRGFCGGFASARGEGWAEGGICG